MIELTITFKDGDAEVVDCDAWHQVLAVIEFYTDGDKGDSVASILCEARDAV